MNLESQHTYRVCDNCGKLITGKAIKVSIRSELAETRVGYYCKNCAKVMWMQNTIDENAKRF